MIQAYLCLHLALTHLEGPSLEDECLVLDLGLQFSQLPASA